MAKIQVVFAQVTWGDFKIFMAVMLALIFNDQKILDRYIIVLKFLQLHRFFFILIKK